MSKKIFYLLILSLVVALGLSACGQTEAPAEPEPAADTAATETESEPAVEPAEEEAMAEEEAEPAEEAPGFGSIEEEAEPAEEEAEAMAMEGGPEITDLTVGVLPIIDVAPLYLAIDKGYFADEGLTVTPQIGQGGAAIVAATVSGDFQVGFSAYTSFFQAQEAGIELRILAEANRATPGFGGVYTKSDSGITSPADLVGPTVSVPTLNSIGPLSINAVLADQGIDISGMNYLEIPFPEIIANLEEGNVDAILTVEPFTTFATSAGHVSVIDPFSGPTEGLPVAGYAVTREFAEANPNTVAGFQRALLKAAADAQANPEEVQDIVLTYTRIPPEVVPNLNLPEFPTDVDQAELQRFADLMIEFGFLEQAPNLDELILPAPEMAMAEEAMAAEEEAAEPSGEPSPDAPAAIEVGAVVPLTGRFAGGGAQVERGYQMAVEDINAAGGVFVEEFNANIPLNLNILDDESDPSKTVSHLETHYSDTDVTAYLGGFGSGLHAAAAAIAEKNQVPYLGVAFALWGVHQQGYQYLFSPFFKSPDLGVNVYEALNETVPEGERPTRVGIFQEQTDWGIELGNIWQDKAEEFGYEVVVYEEYAPLTEDFTDLILKAQEADVELLLGLPNPPDGVTIFKQMGELGYTPKFTFFVRAPDVPTWSESLGVVGDYVALAPGWHNAVKYPGVDEINAKHTELIGRPADPMVGPSYAAVQILADAIERAGTLDRAAIRDAIAATDMETVIGPVTFNEDGTGNVPFVLLQYQNGKPELVWPTEFATADLVYPAPPFEER